MILLLPLLACREAEIAPPEIDETTRQLWTQWEDAEQVEQLIADLVLLTDDLDYEANWQERSYTVTAFPASEVEGIVDHGLDPADTFGLGVVFQSEHPPEKHMDLIRIEDRTIVEASSPNLYTRTFVEGDPDCMLDRSCDLMRAHNLIRRESFFYGTMTYEMNKDYRWIPSENGDALVARAYQLAPNEETDNKVLLFQSYTLDIWIPVDGGSRRYNMSWQQTEVGSLDAADIEGVLGAGIETLMADQDEWLSENR